MRVYVDEDVSREIANALKARHDASHVQDTHDRGKTDAWHLQRASMEGRVMITANHTDFRFLHRVWTSMRVFGVTQTRHSGILTITRTPNPPARWISPLLDILGSAEELAGRLLVWHSNRDEWREDDWRPDD